MNGLGGAISVANCAMKKIFQTEWQDIQFSEFAKLSSTNLAGPEFYQAFYETFFGRYQNWGELSPSWRKTKETWANFILARTGPNSRVLSVGCGLGFIEHCIRAQNPRLDLFIHEVAPSAWRWVGDEFAAQRKLTGLIPACLPTGTQFDLVYLATVDYSLDDDALVGLLAAIRPFLTRTSGQCLLISASFQDVPKTFAEKAGSALARIKAFTKTALNMLGLRNCGQFWGWNRTRKEYRVLMQRAGYRDLEDGFIEPKTRAHYWISGR